jgi:hypothetical protein
VRALIASSNRFFTARPAACCDARAIFPSAIPLPIS